MATVDVGGQRVDIPDDLFNSYAQKVQSGTLSSLDAQNALIQDFRKLAVEDNPAYAEGYFVKDSTLFKGYNYLLSGQSSGGNFLANALANTTDRSTPVSVPGSVAAQQSSGTTTPNQATQQTQQQSQQQAGVQVGQQINPQTSQPITTGTNLTQTTQTQQAPQYINANGAYFQQTPAGLAVVNDPNILRQLKSGQIQSKSGFLGSQQITGVSAPDLLPPSARNATPEQGLQAIAQSNPQLADDIMNSLGYSGDPGELDSVLSQAAQANPVKFVSDFYSQIYANSGLADIKSQFETWTKRLEDLNNDMNEEIADVNDNPWLSEGIRIRQIEKIQDKYEGKISSATNTAKLLQGFYDDGLEQTRFLTQQALAIYNDQVDFQQDVYLKAIDRAQDREDAIWKQGVARENTLFQFGLDKELAAFKAGLDTDQDQPTQAEFTVAGYAQRLKQSGNIIDSIENQIASMNTLRFLAESKAPNTLKSALIQSYEQAARNFINAVLRRESGAAIAESEFESARRQYLPQPGDSAATLAQKRQNRATSYQALVNASGSALNSVDDADPLGLGLF